jgi:hypothetical protein
MAPGGGKPESMLEIWRQTLKLWKEMGRQGQPRWVGASYFALGPKASDQASAYIDANYGYNPELAARRLRGIPTTAEAVEEAIKRQTDMGVDEFILRPGRFGADGAAGRTRWKTRRDEVSDERFLRVMMAQGSDLVEV